MARTKNPPAAAPSADVVTPPSVAAFGAEIADALAPLVDADGAPVDVPDGGPVADATPDPDRDPDPEPAAPSAVCDDCFPLGVELTVDGVTSIGCEHGSWALQDDGTVEHTTEQE